MTARGRSRTRAPPQEANGRRRQVFPRCAGDPNRLPRVSGRRGARRRGRVAHRHRHGPLSRPARATSLVLRGVPRRWPPTGACRRGSSGPERTRRAGSGAESDGPARHPARRRCRWWSTRVRSISAARGGAAHPHAARPGARAAARRPRARRGAPTRIPSARAAAETAAASGGVVLKGAVTVVASPERLRPRCRAGTPWLATAGTGDVLAGVIGALVAGVAAGAGCRPRGARGDRRVAARARGAARLGRSGAAGRSRRSMSPRRCRARSRRPSSEG